jgi:hypothetical protein
MRDLSRKLNNAGTLRVGFLERARYPDGTPVAMVAAIQNFGAPRRNIPPRPFFSAVGARLPTEGPRVAVAALKATGLDARRAMDLIGEHFRGEIQQSIRDTNSPPLKPATVRRKGFQKPLVDTGHMLASVSYEIK